MKPLRVAIVCDLAEEEWPSMDLVAERLIETFRRDFAGEIEGVALRPAMRRRFTRLPGAAAHPRARILDRLANRHFDYPRWLSRHRDGFDVFHVVDHSYAQLVNALPADRTVVTCHDMDAFRCVLFPEQEHRSAAYRVLARRTIAGLRRAARVACDSAAVRDELLASGLVDPARLRVIRNGVDDLFSPDPDAEADARAQDLLGDRAATIDVLHVGSVIPRKRIDVLLRAFAVMLRAEPRARLVRVGGALTVDQVRQAEQLGIEARLVSLPFVDTRLLAAVYRRAAVCLLPSDREGFGFPVLEALACGVPVVAADLPALRETGGEAAVYCPTGNADAFAEAALRAIASTRGPDTDPASLLQQRHDRVQHARRFSWHAYAAAVNTLYRKLA
jgi:glycosyltransferase involved in cell wall biosynthesis